MTDRQRKVDYVPQNAAQFAAHVRTALEYINSRKTDWGTHIPKPTLDNLWALFDIFNDALEQTLGQHTPAQTLARNEAQAVLTKAWRAFVNQYLRFAPVNNVDRLEMGIPNHDTIRTNHIDVNEMVEFLLKPGEIRTVNVEFWVQGADNKAKPYGYDGAVVIWQILEKAPADHTELVHHALASRTPFKIHFDETERRKQVYVAIAWQNARGLQGQYSEIKAIYVP